MPTPIGTARLQLVRGMERLASRSKDRQHLVAAHLDDSAIVLIGDSVRQLAEACRQARSGGVAVLLGEARVAANIGDQEDENSRRQRRLAWRRLLFAEDFTEHRRR
jgi:hypothetical protein